MKLPPIAAIFFDMDGTLVDSEHLWQDVEAELVMSRGRALNRALHASFTGLASPVVIGLMRDAYGFCETEEALLAELYERLLFHLESVGTRDGAVGLLDLVADRAIPCALVSNSARVIIEAALKNQPWQAMFPRRFSAEQVDHAKPAPDLYLYAAAQLGVAAEQCLVFEDSLAGVRAAVAAKMICIAVPEGGDLTSFYDLTPYVYTDLKKLSTDLSNVLKS